MLGLDVTLIVGTGAGLEVGELRGMAVGGFAFGVLREHLRLGERPFTMDENTRFAVRVVEPTWKEQEGFFEDE